MYGSSIPPLETVLLVLLKFGTLEFLAAPDAVSGVMPYADEAEARKATTRKRAIIAIFVPVQARDLDRV
jgi:hypothetical protein